MGEIEIAWKNKNISELENIIKVKIIGAFYYAGKAFKIIKEYEKWKTAEYIAKGIHTFEEYCAIKWNFSKDTIYNLIKASGIVDNLLTNVNILLTGYPQELPLKESIARPLKVLDIEGQNTVWKNVLKETKTPTERMVRKHIREYLNPPAETPPFPDNKYNVIYADPPWKVESIVLDEGKWEEEIGYKYQRMSLMEIMELPVSDLAFDDCSLFLWTTHTWLPSAFDVMKMWGFKYHVCITWYKHGGMTLNGFHRNTELCLYGYKGKMNIPKTGTAFPLLIDEPKREHSRKPEKMYQLIEERISEPRIELFARDNRKSWDSWGHQTNGSV